MNIQASIRKITGKTPEIPKKPYPDELTVLMTVHEGQTKYTEENGQITGLNLANSELTDQQWNELVETIDLSKLKALNLNGNQLTTLNLSYLPELEILEIAGNKELRNLKFEVALPGVKRLTIRDNGLSRLEFSGNWSDLILLDLSRNDLKQIHFEEPMPKLEILDMSGNKFKNIDMDWLALFPVLEYWYLGNNPLNHSLKVLHDEAERNNYLNTLKKLKKEFEDGKGILNEEYKVLVVGDGTAGKTCLVNRLMENKFIREDSTHGIVVRKFPCENSIKNGFPYTLNIWDFGGQDIYHTTHRLFLQSDALYLLVWNKNTEETDTSSATIGRRTRDFKNRKLAYWMKYVTAYGKGSPVVVVRTKKDEHGAYRLKDEGKIIEKYKSQLEYLTFEEVDSGLDDIDENGYDNMLYKLKRAVKSMGREEYLPESWVEVRQYLEDLIPVSLYKNKNEFLTSEDATIDYQTYHDEALKYHKDPKLLLTKWLVPMGTVFYKEGYFEDKIILNQEWAIRAIYILFERREDLGYYYDIRRKKGRIKGEDLRTYWKGYGEKEQQLFIDFMLACGMCYEVFENDDNRYYNRKSFEERLFIAPEMLPEERPDEFNMLEKEWNDRQEKNIRLRYDYDFPYYNHFQQFLVRTQGDAEQMIAYYRYGMRIYDGGAKAIIEFNEVGACIEVQVSENGKILLDRIRNRFQEIHNNTPVETWVGIGKHPMIKVNRLDKIGGLDPKTQIETQKGSLVEAGIYQVFTGPDEKEVFKKEIPEIEKTEIFFSYAWKDDKDQEREVIVDRLYEELESEGKYTLKRDKKDVGYKDSIQKFMEELGCGNIVVVVISDKYLHSPYCMLELMSIFQNAGANEEEFMKRIFPIKIGEVDISNLSARKKYILHWKNKCKTTEDDIMEIGLDLASEASLEEYKRTKKIKRNMDRIGEVLSKYNTFNPQILSENNFQIIKEAIAKRAEELNQ